MTLSLPEKMFLLSYDTRRGRLANRQFRGQILRAAALAELVLGGQLADADGQVCRTTATPPTDPFLAFVLQDVLPDQSYGYRRLIGRQARVSATVLREQLADEGAITVRRESVLGLIPRHDITLADPALAQRLQAAARDAVTSARPVEDVDTGDAALAVLAAAGELRTVFSRAERHQHKARLRALDDRLGTAAPALRRAIAATRAAAASASAAATGG